MTLHDEAAPGQTASAAPDRIRTDERPRQLVQGAELITVQVSVGSLEAPLRAYEAGGACGGRDDQRCLRQAFDDVEADWRALSRS